MDWNSLLTWILIALFLIGILAFYQASFKAERKTKNIAFDAIIIAIILVMGLIPQVGYLFILPWLALTLLHIPVLVGASIGGAKRGALYGLVFGLTSMAQLRPRLRPHLDGPGRDERDRPQRFLRLSLDRPPAADRLRLPRRAFLFSYEKKS